ncbi:hypothetical protein RvY_17400 [Ramazzottius varieornatus]|uniref:Uncharacterized protein n=1 Tax=Ramazzottius varieornatus TaxID=947166 RepID=A0A1D1W2F8_RAMVA|nr:hypothetical protein RvY_17400 [Ramazzottius varieornatus]
MYATRALDKVGHGGTARNNRHTSSWLDNRVDCGGPSIVLFLVNFLNHGGYSRFKRIRIKVLKKRLIMLNNQSHL